MSSRIDAGARCGDEHGGDQHGPAAERVGHDVLGPIFTEFAHRLWILQHFLPGGDDACLLFCARGGLRLRLIYENFLSRTGLHAPLPYADLMISRLVAARTSIATPGSALLDELGREFRGQTMAAVALALTQDPAADLGPAWHKPFEPAVFVKLLHGGASDTAKLRETIARLNRAFHRHLEAASQGRSRIVLCDTGLYGSTARLLRDGMPEKQWLSAQFARSNYKAFPTPHFDTTIGLSVERDYYAPWNARTAVLRFWHLIESVLEPDLESVRTFTDEARPRANLEVPGWRDRIDTTTTGLFTGVMAHIHNLSSAELPRIGRRADAAWRNLHRLIVWPQPRDVSVLTLSPRARDFGRTEPVDQFPENKPVRSSLWREGALINRYPLLRRGALLLLEAAYTGRAIMKFAKTRRGIGKATKP